MCAVICSPALSLSNAATTVKPRCLNLSAIAFVSAVELPEKRKDACVAREFEAALPEEPSPAERRRLGLDFAKDMANREGCAVDVAIHAPGREGDNRNHHILRTTRKVEVDGLGAKLDTEKAGRKRSDDLEAVRAKWADLTNERLRDNGIAARVDHRSLEAQGIDREPAQHLGPAATSVAPGSRATSASNGNGKQQARQAFEQFKVEQQAQQRQAERKQQAEKERQQPRRSRDNDGPGWSR
ncbi:MAG: hypothetical protein E5299_01721 [Burkholderia gladioli]|nr:MAG: hypothetical protein E5299_01721 [Burkholderia gladioli]